VSPAAPGPLPMATPKPASCSLCADLEVVRYDDLEDLARPFCGSCGRILRAVLVESAAPPRLATGR
jgi:hypothetical protein